MRSWTAPGGARGAIEDEVEVQADVIKASLNRILGGIASLHDARWQQASSAAPRVVEDA